MALSKAVAYAEKANKLAPNQPAIMDTLGVLLVDEKKKKDRGRERNDRLLMVPLAALRAEHLNTHEDLSRREREELQHFFLTVVAFTNSSVTPSGPPPLLSITGELASAPKRSGRMRHFGVSSTPF